MIQFNSSKKVVCIYRYSKTMAMCHQMCNLFLLFVTFTTFLTSLAFVEGHVPGGAVIRHTIPSSVEVLFEIERRMWSGGVQGTLHVPEKRPL